MTVDEALKKIKNEGIKIVIVDFDDTICDLKINWDNWYKGIHEIFKSFDPSFQGNFNEGNEAELQNLFIRKYGDPIRQKLNEFVKKYEKENAKGCPPLDRIVNIIRKLEGNELWVWSSNPKQTVEKYLTELGIYDRFSKFITRDNVDFIKPDPDGFTKNVPANTELLEYLMMGNSKNDRLAAKAAGIKYIDVSEIEE